MDNNTKLFRWVKASDNLEKLPLEKMIHVRDNIGHDRLGNFYKEEDGSLIFSVITTEMYSGYNIPQNHFNNLFYLGEYIPKFNKEDLEKLANKYFEDNDGGMLSIFSSWIEGYKSAQYR